MTITDSEHHVEVSERKAKKKTHIYIQYKGLIQLDSIRVQFFSFL
jgi:hypothetical protein